MLNNLFSLDGKVAIVTGGSKGLGETFALALACLELGVPYLLVTTLQVGPLVVPGTTACHACYEGAARREHAFYDAMVTDSEASGSSTTS